MKKVPLGRSGAQVSALCLGAMFFGTRTDSATSLALLDRYTEAGGSFIDTANIYAAWVPGFKGGESEVLLGRWMKERRNRSSLFIATKVGFGYGNVEKALKPALIESECEKSLRRLGVNSIDLYYAHVDDRDTPQDESLAAFERLVAAGKIRAFGASNFLAWRLAQAQAISLRRGSPGYCCIQQRHSYYRPARGASFGAQIAANDDLVDYCGSQNVTLLAYSPLLGGAYSRKDRPIPEQYRGHDTDVRAKRLEKLGREIGATSNQLVLAWMMCAEPAVIPVMAASTMDQLEENLGALDVHLDSSQMQELSSRASI